MNYFFYIFAYYGDAGITECQGIWAQIRLDIVELFGREGCRWQTSISQYAGVVPVGIYFAEPDDATAFSLKYNQAVFTKTVKQK